MEFSTFRVDVTPPTGTRLAYVINERVDSPIFVCGILLEDAGLRVAVVACDFIYIWGGVWLEWRRALAGAIGVPDEQVLLHSVHQHDSMRIAPEMNEFLTPGAQSWVDEEYCRRTLEKICQAAHAAANGQWIAVEKIMAAERRVHGLASNRRMLDSEGRWVVSRISMCRHPELRARPTGVIDPFLRTIALMGKDSLPLAALHFYASHPMAAYMRNGVSRDVPGVALDHLARSSENEAFHLYLTGCAGNVSFGKYFTGDKEESLQLLGERLGRELVKNMECLEEISAPGLSLASADFELPLVPDIAQVGARELAEAGTYHRFGMAKVLIGRDLEKWKNCRLQRLSFGDRTHLLSFPSEVCVEYQLYAQSLLPEHFVACAAYANGIYHYIPTDQMFEEGGYEVIGSVVAPGIERRFKAAISQLLQGLG
jgi:hypothetical protein